MIRTSTAAVVIRKVILETLKMSVKSPMECIKENAKVTKEAINTLKDELKMLNESYNNLRAKQLLDENQKLTRAVEEAKNKLIQLEVKNGKKQIQIPIALQNVQCSQAENTQQQQLVGDSQVQNQKDVENKKVGKAKKEKTVKEGKPKSDPQEELPVDIGRLDLRIGKVVDVQKHPDADSLYVLKISCGEENPRTVCSGLVKHVPIEELRDRFVMMLCNLKPVKMRGVLSEAMVMCASTPDLVEVLIPPAGCAAGDLVECCGYKRQPDSVMNPKKKIFETVAPDLQVNSNREACYKGVTFSVCGRTGNFLAKSLKNVPVK